MPVPKKKHSRSRQGKRRASWKAYAPGLSRCPSCGEQTLPYHACPACGIYKGKQVLKIKEKKTKKENK